MSAERLEKLRGQWRTVSLWNSPPFSEGASLLFIFDECIHCGYRTRGEVEDRRRQIAAHEELHPKERDVTRFWHFRDGLHYAAMDLCPYFGIDSLEWKDVSDPVPPERRARPVEGDGQ